MNILLFTDADVFAGTERHMFDLALALRSHGADARIACPVPSPLAGKAASAGIRVVAIPKKGLVDWGAVWTLAQLLRSGAVQVVHAHNGRTALASALAVTLAGKGSAVATQHFLEPNHTSQRGITGLLSQAAHRWVSRQTRQFIAISQAVQQEMARRGEAHPGKITVVPNGLIPLDLSRLEPREAVRAALGIGPEAPLVVCAARLEKEKDVASLIKAMSLVKAAIPDAVCIVAGEGSQRSQLTEQITSAKLGSTVRLLGFRTDVLALINASDLFVLPSLAEPFGLVLLEAMALGKPVIATAIGGPLEIVDPGHTGILVPPGRPDALAEAIVTLLSDCSRMQDMGLQGLLRFQGQFTAAQMAQKTLSVYQAAGHQAGSAAAGSERHSR